MALFKIYDCDFGITIRGTNYTFENVENMGVENPERKRLTRGANASNKKGITYREGNKEAKTVTVTLLGIPKALHDLLKEIYEDEERVSIYAVSRVDGSSKIGNNAILSQEPMQMNIDESAESLNTALVFETFDFEEKHKS